MWCPTPPEPGTRCRHGSTGRWVEELVLRTRSIISPRRKNPYNPHHDHLVVKKHQVGGDRTRCPTGSPPGRYCCAGESGSGGREFGRGRGGGKCCGAVGPGKNSTVLRPRLLGRVARPKRRGRSTSGPKKRRPPPRRPRISPRAPTRRPSRSTARGCVPLSEMPWATPAPSRIHQWQTNCATRGKSAAWSGTERRGIADTSRGASRNDPIVIMHTTTERHTRTQTRNTACTPLSARIHTTDISKHLFKLWEPQHLQNKSSTHSQVPRHQTSECLDDFSGLKFRNKISLHIVAVEYN